MRYRPVAFAVLAILPFAFGLGTCRLAAAASPASAAIEFGFNDVPDPNKYALQVLVGATIRRTLAGWNGVEPAPNKWNWTQLDSQYGLLVFAHLRPLFVVLAPPCWTHPSLPCQGPDTGATPPDPAYDRAWSEFIRRLAKRYPLAVGIEVWNEENLSQTFLPAADPVRYTQLLKAAYRAVKSVRPGLPVISGGLFASTVTGAGGVADAQFLAGMYAAGAKGFIDGVGVHPYPLLSGPAWGLPRYDPAVLEQILGRIRAVRTAAGDTRTPLWITELGVPAPSPLVFAPTETERAQAADLVAMMHDMRRDGDVKLAIIHRLIDPPLSLDAEYHVDAPGFGVFQDNNTPKPAACALTIELHGTLPC